MNDMIGEIEISRIVDNIAEKFRAHGCEMYDLLCLGTTAEELHAIKGLNSRLVVLIYAAGYERGWNAGYERAENS
jgi:hypothetical protein